MPRYAAVLLALCAIAPVAAPSSVEAQSRLAITPFVARDQALPERPMLAGLSATYSPGLVGLRVGLGVDPGGAPAVALGAGPAADRVRGWAADVDAVLGPVEWKPLNDLLGGVQPSAFAGVGIHGAARADAGFDVAPAFSYGAGAAYPVAHWLRVEGEARRRLPWSEAATSSLAAVPGGWEYRLGVSFVVRGRGGRSAPAAAPAPAPRPTARPAASTARRDGGLLGTPANLPAAGDAASADYVAATTLSGAEEFLGVPYVWGGTNPAIGFDCSGFVQYVFRDAGIQLPRVSRDQARVGEPVPTNLSQLAPGDLLFFASDGDRVDHVAIYAGGGRMIHSSRSGQGVRYDDLRGRRGAWYVEHMVGARRVIDRSADPAERERFRRYLDDLMKEAASRDPAELEPEPADSAAPAPEAKAS